MGHLGVVLYEYLGEEYPEVLGSILGALKAIVNVIGRCNLNFLEWCLCFPLLEKGTGLSLHLYFQVCTR